MNFNKMKDDIEKYRKKVDSKVPEEIEWDGIDLDTYEFFIDQLEAIKHYEGDQEPQDSPLHDDIWPNYIYNDLN